MSAAPVLPPSSWLKRATWPSLDFLPANTALVRIDCMATIGQVGNIDHANVSIGKAGRSATWAEAHCSVLQ